MSYAEKVDRIVVNYLSNASKYGEPCFRGRGRQISLVHRGAREGSRTGVPITRSSNGYSRSSRGTDDPCRRDHPGTGLGLSIVRGLALANGRDAWYEPNVPIDSCFGVKLPIAV